jgi:2-oxo-3-hexenedioate decarboxylase/2-keto-4-pentenoate hydratase
MPGQDLTQLRPEQVHQAAQLLHQARHDRRRIAGLPMSCGPKTLLDGYAIQKEGIRLAQDRLIGWKVGCISPESQRKAKTSEPFCGPILQRDLYRSGCSIASDAYFTCALQVEFAFRLACDLPLQDAPFSLTRIREAVGKIVPALEIADSRFADLSRIEAPSLIADAGKAGVFIIGSGEAELEDIDLINQEVTLSINGAEVARGHGRNVLGDPVKSLQWLANSMARREEYLMAGQLISSGTCTGSYMATPGDCIIAHFGKLGIVEARLAA